MKGPFLNSRTLAFLKWNGSSSLKRTGHLCLKVAGRKPRTSSLPKAARCSGGSSTNFGAVLLSVGGMCFSWTISLLHWRLLRVGPAHRTSPLSCAAFAPTASLVGRAFRCDGCLASTTRPIVRRGVMTAISCRSVNLKKPGITAPGRVTALRAPMHRRSARSSTLASSRARSSGTPALRNLLRMWPLLGGFITPLQIAAVSAATTIQYVETFLEFARWVKATHPQALAGPEPPDQKLLDLLAHHYFEHLFEQGALPATGSKLLAALLHLHPVWGSKVASAFPRSTRSLRGWHHLRPAVTRQPLPFLALLAILTDIIYTNRRLDLAICLLLGFSCYLRPREMSSLLVGQLIPPQPAGGLHFAHWCLNLHPCELPHRSKTGKWDESIILDSDYTNWLDPFMRVLVTGRSPDLALWPFDHQELINALKTSAARTGVQTLSPCLYALRHGGASHDALNELRPLHAIKERGRWANDESLRRYKKAARAQAELAKLPAATLALGHEMSLHLEKYFHEPALLQPHVNRALRALDARR